MTLNVNTTIVVPVQLRLCREDDLEKLEWFGAYSDHRSIIRAAFDAQRAGTAAMVVVTSRDFPIGQVWVDFRRFAPKPIALLWALRVIEPFQGNGLARRLISAAEHVAWRNGCTVAEIESEADQEGTQRLYEHLGFTRSGCREDVWTYTTPAGADVERRQSLVVLEKPLKQRCRQQIRRRAQPLR